ncbi:alkaline phosphatase family protein [bacterium]|nr:alkaline phosphatase family protein [bacterium]
MTWPRTIGPGQIPPDYPNSICAVLPTALSAIGVKLPRIYPRLNVRSVARKKFDRLFFFFLDSLGLEVCRKSGGLFSRLLKNHGLALTSVFPSITSAALCSIYTGRPPAKHGIPGHKIYFDEIRSLVDVLLMEIPGERRTLKSSGLPIKHWLAAPPLLSSEFLGRRTAIHVSPSSIVNSGISGMIYPGEMRREGYGEYIEGLSKVAHFLKNGAEVINFYQHAIDEGVHKFGGASSQVAFSLKIIEDGVAWLARQLPSAVRRRSLFVLVSDHGQNTFKPGQVLHFPFSEISAQKKSIGLTAIGTSGRLAHVYSEIFPNPGLEKWLAKKCRGKATVVPRDTSWFLAGGAGPKPAYAHRLGDYTLILHPGSKLRVEFEPPEPERHLRFSAANHGSLTEDEVMVPALFVPMDEIS